MERRKIIKNLAGLGILAGLTRNKMSLSNTNDISTRIGSPRIDGSQVDDWHSELTKRIAALVERGGGTLELGDGVYEISKPLLLPNSVSLVMTPNAVIRARPHFEGDAVIIKSGTDLSDISGLSKSMSISSWIRGGVIDGGLQPLTGLRIEGGWRMEIADLEVLNATYKGIHFVGAGAERNITRVRCNVDLKTHYAPGSIGIHYEGGDSKVILAHVIGYETGLRSDAASNWFTAIHVWNYDSAQGPMLYNFYCNGTNNTFNQCYADSPTIAGFYINAPHQSFVQCRVFYSRWAKDNAGAGFMITPEGKNGTYIGNDMFCVKGHKLGKAFDGDLSGSCILGTSTFGIIMKSPFPEDPSVGVMGGLENRIPSGESSSPDLNTIQHPPLYLAGTGFRMTQQLKPPLPNQGELGEIRWVDDGKVSALWVKTPRGWKKSKLM